MACYFEVECIMRREVLFMMILMTVLASLAVYP